MMQGQTQRMRGVFRRRLGPAGLSVVLALAAIGLSAGPSAAVHEDPSRPNDPLFQFQWGPQQVRVEPAWHRSRGEGSTVAIVDSGIDLDHPDLRRNVVPGRTFLDCGDAGCGNGDWQSGPPEQHDGEPHGTHVAGIAAAVTGNGTGIVGVAPRAKLMAVRVLDDEGSGAFEDVARGIRYATDHGADVVNLSLGALPGVQGFVLIGELADVADAIAYANSKGVTVVAAAGNEAFPLCDTPAFDPGAICVAATDKREQHSIYSNLGVKPGLDAVSAPGGSLLLVLCYEGVLSTVPAGTGIDDCGYPASLEYTEIDGTSQATPHAAGVAALLVARGCTRAQIHELFRTTSRTPPTDARGVFTPQYGFGIVDADAATAAARAACRRGKGRGGHHGHHDREDDEDDDDREHGRDDDKDDD